MVEPLIGVSIAMSPIVVAIRGIYEIASDLNDRVDDHIRIMKGNENPAISKTHLRKKLKRTLKRSPKTGEETDD